MPKYTLLELTQRVLSSTGGDEITSISDTVESADVAKLIEDVFYNLITNQVIPEHKGLIQLTASGTTDRPTHMEIPSGVTNIQSVRYNKDESGGVDYEDIRYCDPESFIMRVSGRTSADANVQSVVDPSGPTLLIYNDRMPNYYTSFDDDFIIFDSFKNTVDSTLQQSKTLIFGTTIPTFSQQDTFVPDIDENLFPALLNEAKSWAHLEDRQQAHPKAEQNARKQRYFSQANRHNLRSEKPSRPDYGRRR
jgi:hypothetical protein